jgi:hypothetical protein
MSLGAAIVPSGISTQDSSELLAEGLWLFAVQVSVTGDNVATFALLIDPIRKFPFGSTQHGASPILAHTAGGDPPLGPVKLVQEFATGS